MKVLFKNIIILGCLIPLLTLSAKSAIPAEVRISDGQLQAYLNGKLFFACCKDPKPYLYPVYGPSGKLMVRNFPMKKVEGEETDHPHHRGLWFTHGKVNEVDYWLEGAKQGKIIQQEIVSAVSGEKGSIKTINHWIKPDKKTVQLKEERELQFFEKDGKWYLDINITLIPVEGDITLGDTKEGTLGFRVAESMRVKGGLNKGHILNSNGIKDGATWSKRAEWVDYYGPVDDQIVGVAILDHPSNLRHPTWWHVRDYGLFAANPFGIHDFEPKKDGKKTSPNEGNYLLKKDDQLTFKYRFIFHDGPSDTIDLKVEFEEYSK